jgi:hypothetical protein
MTKYCRDQAREELLLMMGGGAATPPLEVKSQKSKVKSQKSIFIHS